MNVFLGSRWALFAVAATFVSGVHQARAGFDVHTASIPSHMTTDFKLPLTIPAFDTSLGTLRDVIITYANSTNMQGTVVNTSASAQSFKVSETVNFSLSYGGTSLLSNSLTGEQSFSGLAVNATGQFGPQVSSDSVAPLILTGGSLFNAFLTSPSGVTFTFSTLTTTKVAGGGGNITTGIYTKADATLSVFFDYELKPQVTPAPAAVPEPASVLMTGLGGIVVASAGFVRRRARRKSGQ